MDTAASLLTHILTLHLSHKLDEAADLVAAFECFDERDEGVIDAGELRYWLKEVGDCMTDSEVSHLASLPQGERRGVLMQTARAQIDRLLSGPFMDRGGRSFDYKACE